MRCPPSIVMPPSNGLRRKPHRKATHPGDRAACHRRARQRDAVGRRPGRPSLRSCGAQLTTGGGTDVYLAVSRDSAGTFDSPVRVNSRPGTARLGGEFPPRVALSPVQTAVPSPSITVVWGSKGATTEIRSARSLDGGRTFIGRAFLERSGRRRRSRVACAGHRRRWHAAHPVARPSRSRRPAEDGARPSWRRRGHGAIL